MTYINITKFVLINQLENDHSMTEIRRLKNAVNSLNMEIATKSFSVKFDF